MQKKVVFTILALAVAACSSEGPSGVFLNPPEFKTDKIVGGEAVQAVDPIASSTVMIIDITVPAVICTGTIIAEDMILTAAHCTREKAEELAVGFGLELPTEKNSEAIIHLRKVVAGMNHPLWPEINGTSKNAQEKNWGDISILKITGGLPDGFKPIKLLTDKNQLQKGQKVTLAGYGLTSLIFGPRFAERLMKTEVELTDENFSETEVLFAQYKGRGACKGDSGGPAYVHINGETFLMGVTSRAAEGLGGFTCLFGSVYTSVPAKADFIHEAKSVLAGPNAPTLLAQPPESNPLESVD